MPALRSRREERPVLAILEWRDVAASPEERLLVAILYQVLRDAAGQGLWVYRQEQRTAQQEAQAWLASDAAMAELADAVGLEVRELRARLAALQQAAPTRKKRRKRAGDRR